MLLPFAAAAAAAAAVLSGVRIESRFQWHHPLFTCWDQVLNAMHVDGRWMPKVAYPGTACGQTATGMERPLR